MAIKGISRSERETIIPKEDECIVLDKNGKTDVEASLRGGATGFIITNVSSGIMTRIQDMSQYIETEQFTNINKYKNQNAARNREAFKYGVEEFINFPDRSGEMIICEREQTLQDGRVSMVITDRCLDRVPTSVLNEIGSEVIKLNSLTEEQAKNSEALLSRLAASVTSNVTDADTKSDDGADTTKDTPSKTLKVNTKSPEKSGGTTL